VSPGNRLKLWKMKLTVRRRNSNKSFRFAPEILCPATVTVTAVASSSAPIRLSRVVFPLPDGPRTTANSPSSISRSTPASAVTLTPPSS
jgi:hypothetical protein